MKTSCVLLAASLLCVSSSCRAADPAPAPYRFQNVTFIAGGFITGFVAHPSQRGLYYVRTDIGGAYRWDNAVKRWSPLQDWLPFSDRNLLGAESIAIDPTDANKLYIAAGTYTNNGTPNGAILRSATRGATSASRAFRSRWAATRMAVSPENGCRWTRTIRKRF